MVKKGSIIWLLENDTECYGFLQILLEIQLNVS